MDREEKVKENRLRRMAERQGLRLEKSRRRDPHALDYGGYMLVDPTNNGVVMGADAYAYSADLDQVEEWLTSTR